MDDHKRKALSAALGQIEKQFGKGSVMRMGDVSAARDIDVVSTGSLALDVALSPEACQIKGLESVVGGAADILVFPNIESGNVFYKSSTLLSGARLAGADLSNADLTAANLGPVDLKNGDGQLTGKKWPVNLVGANLTDTDLSDADLRNANMAQVDLSRTELAGAQLENAILSEPIQ